MTGMRAQWQSGLETLSGIRQWKLRLQLAGRTASNHKPDNVGDPIAGGIVSYASGGKQYVAAVSGFVGGYYNQMAPEIGGENPTITVFALKPNAASR
jgi:hypothetical protein